MKKIYLITTQKILVMFIFITIGFLMRKKKILPEQSGKVLSVLETNLFLPAMIFNNLSLNLNRAAITNYFITLVIGTGFLIAIIAVAKIIANIFGKTRETKNLFTYIFAFSNYAYFGYPIIERVFGSKMLTHTIIFAVPFTITIFTYGVYLLVGKQMTEKMSLNRMLKSLLKPVLIAVILGTFCGLLSIKIPDLISDVLLMASGCMSPVSMILTGFVLTAFSPAELFKSITAYAASLVRLVVIPAIFACTLWLIGLRGENYVLPVIISAMPVGMNVVIFAEAYGKDSKYSARICFVSYVFSLVTIPIVFTVLSYIMY